LSVPAATTSSLMIVGAAAFAGVLPRIRNETVNIPLGLTFALLGIAGTFLGTRIAAVAPDLGVLIFMVILMFVSAGAMWRGPKSANLHRTRIGWPMTIVVASVVGLITGLLGIGGGFLITPALIFLLAVPTGIAVGTSLVAIATNAVITLLLRIDLWDLVPVTPVAVFTGTAVLASLFVSPFARKLNARIVQRSFAALLAVVGVVTVLTY
jgi:uncharacterized protein